MEIFKARQEHIRELTGTLKREQLAYQEYRNLTDAQLRLFVQNKLLAANERDTSINRIAIRGAQIEGFIACTKDEFDSENFGFPCYRITDLYLNTIDFVSTKNTLFQLFKGIEKELQQHSSRFYLSFGLSNNIVNFDMIFNSLTSLEFYYIHTLLTFGSNNQTFDTASSYTVREALNSDAKQVSELAEKSFRFSRFHLDPYLDDQKASGLLKKSAKNSILDKFVDVLFVAEIDGHIAGYYSGKKQYISEFGLTKGEAVISAVDSSFRGKKIFSEMDSHLINWFTQNTDFAEMGTYLINFPVHKTWINKGLPLVRGMHQFSKMIG